VGKRKCAIENGLRKIQISGSDNDAFYLNNSSNVHAHFDKKYLSRLRSYLKERGFDPVQKSEWEFVTQAMAWVTSQWQHDGMNQPPVHFTALDILRAVHQKASQYRCVEYGLVLAEVLQTYGFATRRVGLQSVDVAYGGFGQGHVGMEVWLNDLRKWVFLDPQFGVYMTRNGESTPLNCYELFCEKQKRRWAGIKVHFVVAPEKKLTSAMREYKTFLRSYFGHITFLAGKGMPRLALLLENPNPSLTFQGQITNRIVFTKNPDHLYFDINRVTVEFEYQKKPANFQEVAKKYGIRTEQDYLVKMPFFAASPEYWVIFHHNMQGFSHFEIRFNRHGEWIETQKPRIRWNATNELNYLEVRAINDLGRPGPSTYCEISYATGS